jgi:hypothetical protein
LIVHISPSFAGADAADEWLGYAESMGDLPMRAVSDSNRAHLFVSKSPVLVDGGERARSPERVAFRAATLREFVSDIVGVCSEKKVVWVNARTIVATVKNVETNWDLSFGGDPSPSVSARFAPAKLQKSVTATIRVAPENETARKRFRDRIVIEALLEAPIVRGLELLGGFHGGL